MSRPLSRKTEVASGQKITQPFCRFQQSKDIISTYPDALISSLSIVHQSTKLSP